MKERLRHLFPISLSTIYLVVAGNPPLSANTILFVEILDENDNYPVFRNPLPKAIRISENAEVHSFLTSVPATDADQGKFCLMTPDLLQTSESHRVEEKRGRKFF